MKDSRTLIGSFLSPRHPASMIRLFFNLSDRCIVRCRNDVLLVQLEGFRLELFLQHEIKRHEEIVLVMNQAHKVMAV